MTNPSVDFKNMSSGTIRENHVKPEMKQMEEAQSYCKELQIQERILKSLESGDVLYTGADLDKDLPLTLEEIEKAIEDATDVYEKEIGEYETVEKAYKEKLADEKAEKGAVEQQKQNTANIMPATERTIPVVPQKETETKPSDSRQSFGGGSVTSYSSTAPVDNGIQFKSVEMLEAEGKTKHFFGKDGSRYYADEPKPENGEPKEKFVDKLKGFIGELNINASDSWDLDKL